MKLVVQRVTSGKVSAEDKVVGEIQKGYVVLCGIKKGDTKEIYIDRYSKFSTFAVVINGKWYERGSMGWWGIVSDEKDEKGIWLIAVSQTPSKILASICSGFVFNIFLIMRRAKPFSPV